MFTDYLYQTINDNLVTDTSLFPDLSARQVRKAIRYVKSSQALPDDGIETIVARFLFAKTLKNLLENPKSDLSVELADKDSLRETLQQAYLYSIEMINKHFGRKFVAPMPGPFVVPDITAIVGTLEKPLAEGTYGEVYSTSKGYAVKKFLATTLDESTMRETSILRYLDHPNVINLVAMQLEPPNIAMPLAAGTLEGLQLDKEKRKWYFYQLFRGLAYCHNKHVWHQDLKPANVLLFDDPSISGQLVKLADFGLALPYARQGDNYTTVVSLWWRAPELLLDDKNYSGAVDVWSLGVMLMDALIGDQLLAGDSEHNELEKIFKLLGTPTESDWPGVTIRLETKGVASFKFSRGLDAEIGKVDPDEMEVINNTVTWPNKRMSALDVLKLSYFDAVRDKIETEIPAAPITVQSCGKMMLNEQQKIIQQTWFKEKNRQRIYGWLWEVKKSFWLRNRTFFFAIYLMDLVAGHLSITRVELQKYVVACAFISSDLYEDYVRAESDWVVISAQAYTVKQLLEAKRNILSQLDFKLVIPTCSDFIFHYIKDSGYSKEQHKQILYYALMLMFNYSYAAQYSQAQIAQIAIEAVGLAPECLSDMTRLYDTALREYFAQFKPLPSLEQDHQNYYLPTVVEAKEELPAAPVAVLGTTELVEAKEALPAGLVELPGTKEP
uniref:cyclin-dependent kinase n=1 Tax=Marseillevirus LCMAC202 TaxID=2506606 RepID=A0A481YX56_9VIRU|nr:MAG: cyclin-dependent protein kinase [Marseillevirus LCMAC202]